MKHHKHLTTYTHSQRDLRPVKKIMCEPVLAQHIHNAEENTELPTQPTIQMFCCGMLSAHTLHCISSYPCPQSSPLLPCLL